MGGGAGRQQTGHLAQRANSNISDPMQNMNRGGFPNVRRNDMGGGAGQAGGGGQGGGPFGPVNGAPANDTRMQPTPQAPQYQGFQADRQALQGFAPGQDRAQARAEQRRAYEQQQFVNAGGNAKNFQSFGNSRLGQQQFDDPAARNAARDRYYQNQFNRAAQKNMPQQAPPQGGGMPGQQQIPTQVDPGQFQMDGNMLQQLLQRYQSGGGGQPGSTTGGGK